MTPARIADKVCAWLSIARLQFHPMAFLAYAMGSASAYREAGTFHPAAFWLGYAVIFAIELATIFTNEIFDYHTDVQNVNFSPFTGGSRVLVQGRLGFGEVTGAIGVLVCASAVLAFLLVRVAPHVSGLSVAAYVTLGLVLGLGYTAPPLQFSYRAAGELVVGGTHSFFVVAGGYLFQTGAWARTLPWALSVPLFLSVLPAIILAGIPDRRADEGVSKKTLAVALGPEKAIKMARVLVVSAAAAGLCLRWAGVLPGAAGAGIYGVVLHGGALLLGLSRLLRSRSFDRRIDRVMVLSLSYILWFALVPLLSLVGSPKP